MSVARKLATAQIRRSPRRILAIALASLLSAMAIMATGTFIGTLDRGMAASMAAPLSGADVIVTTDGAPVDVNKLAQIDGVTAVEPVHESYVRATIKGADFDVQLHSLPNTESLRWVNLKSGNWPARADEVLATQEHLDRFGLKIGDTVSFGFFGEASKEATVVGTITTSAPLRGNPWFVAPPAFMETASGAPASEYIVATDGNPSSMASKINSEMGFDAKAAHGAKALTVNDHVNAKIASQTGSTQALTVVFMIFVVIAMLAAVMVIRNTFQVLLSQRLRENGLLRLVGATGSQVQSTVLYEAALIGFVSAVAGVGVGIALGWGVAQLAGLAGGGLVVSIGWVIAALVATTLMTVIAAWAPAARLRNLNPIASLGAANSAAAEREGRRVFSWIIGSLLTVGGAAGVAGAAANTLPATANPFLFILAAVVLAAGLFVLVPLLVPIVMPAIAAPLRAGGPIAKIASENLVRTARRSGTVVLAIAFGGSLVLAMLTAVGGATATFNKQMDEDFAFDAVISDSSGAAIAPEAVAPIVNSDAVSSTAFTKSAEVSAPETGTPFTEVTTVPESVSSAFTTPLQDGEILVSASMAGAYDLKDGDQIVLTDTDGKAVTLTIHLDEAFDGLGSFTSAPSIVGGVTETTLAEFAKPVDNSRLWVQAPANTIDNLAKTIDEVRVAYNSLQLEGPMALQQMIMQAINMLVMFVLAMLALTIVISALGLASVVALAVGERRREIALLRALGTSRGGVRRMVLIESVVLACTGAGFAILIGIPLGMAAVPALIPLGGTQQSIPWVAVLVVLVVAIGIGVLAGTSPARKATRIAPAQALAQQ